MVCSDFLKDFSDYFDGEVEPDVAERFESHLEFCSSCRRYAEVVQSGIDQLRSLPQVTFREDFHPRLQHRLFHLDDGEALSWWNEGRSRRTAVAVLTLAVLAVLVSWKPFFAGDIPEVELPAIVVSRPPAEAFRRNPASFFTGDNLLGSNSSVWSQERRLLYQYSPLSARQRRASVLRRTGLD